MARKRRAAGMPQFFSGRRNSPGSQAIETSDPFEMQRSRGMMVREFSTRADTIDEENRTIRATLSTDDPVLVFDYRKWRMIEEVLTIDGAQFKRQVPMLDSHWRYSTGDMLGSIRDIKKEDGRIDCQLAFANANVPNAERAWQLAREKHLTDVSVGYRYSEKDFVDIAPGQTATVRGREYKAGKDFTLRVVTRWTVIEGSLVPIGADPAAKLRKQDHETDGPTASRGGHPIKTDNLNPEPRRVTPMNKNLRSYLESIGLRADASVSEAWAFFDELDGDQLAEARKMRAAADPPATQPAPPAPPTPARSENTPPAEQPVDQEAIREAAAVAERQRIAAIRELAGPNTPDDAVRRAIDGGMTVDAAGRAFLEAERGATPPPVGNQAPAGHSRGNENVLRALGDSILLRAACCDLPEVIRREPRRGSQSDADLAREIDQRQDEAHRFRSMSFMDLAREAAAAKFGSRTGLYDDETLFERAFSPGALDVVLGNAVNKMLIGAYNEKGDSTEAFTTEINANDFREMNLVRFGADATPKRTPPGKTAEDATLADATETTRVYRYTKKFQVDEQHLIDDNMNVILKMPIEMGKAAKRIRPDLVFALLLANGNMRDGTALFHADHSNLNTSNGLGESALAAARLAMSLQTEFGRTLDLQLGTIVVPETLWFTAQKLLKSVEILNTTASTTYGTYNTAAAMQLNAVYDARLDNGLTDPVTETAYSGSTSSWYGVARDAGDNGIVVSYLRGQKQPKLRQFILDKGTWGYGWDLKFDVGVGVGDWRAICRNDQ